MNIQDRLGRSPARRLGKNVDDTPQVLVIDGLVLDGPLDPNGELDPEEVNVVVILDAGGFLRTLGESTPLFQKSAKRIFLSKIR